MRDKLIDILLEREAVKDANAYDRAESLADFLLEKGVIVPPCKVGSTIYRIDYREQRCSPENVSYDRYYCGECPHLELGFCDYRREVPYIYVIHNATIQAIFGNAHLFGTRAFLTREEAEQALKEAQG